MQFCIRNVKKKGCKSWNNEGFGQKMMEYSNILTEDLTGSTLAHFISVVSFFILPTDGANLKTKSNTTLPYTRKWQFHHSLLRSWTHLVAENKSAL